MYLSPLPRPQPTRGRVAVTWPYLLHCSPPSPPPLTLLIRSLAPPFFHPLPTPSNRSQAPLGLFFFFNPGCKFLPCQQIDCQIIFLQKEKGGGGGKSRSKKRGGGRGKRKRGTEEGRDIPPQSWVWPRAGKQEVRCPAPGPAGPLPRPPPAPPVPRGAALRRARAAGALFAASPAVRCRPYLCALHVREVAPFVDWRDSGREWGGGREQSCSPALDLSVPGCGSLSGEARKSRPRSRRRGREGAALDSDQCRIVSCVAVRVIVMRFAI